MMEDAMRLITCVVLSLSITISAAAAAVEAGEVMCSNRGKLIQLLGLPTLVNKDQLLASKQRLADPAGQLSSLKARLEEIESQRADPGSSEEELAAQLIKLTEEWDEWEVVLSQSAAAGCKYDEIPAGLDKRLFGSYFSKETGLLFPLLFIEVGEPKESWYWVDRVYSIEYWTTASGADCGEDWEGACVVPKDTEAEACPSLEGQPLYVVVPKDNVCHNDRLNEAF
jgi:hypothetical protein